MDGLMMQQIPEERMLLATATLAQDQIKEFWGALTRKQHEFLRFRLMLGSDAEAMHMQGRVRADQDMEKKCKCGRHQPGWIDMRSANVVAWKAQPAFKLVYDLAIKEPVLFAASRMAQLAPMAINAYEEILATGSEAKPSVRRQAAKDVMQSNGLLAVEGVNSKPQSASVLSVAAVMAKERLMRGLELSDGQRATLLAAGFVVPERTQAALPAGQKTERTLDGEDVFEGSFGDSHDTLIPD